MSEEGVTEAVPGLRELAQRFRIRLILQFGSRVTGTTHAHSDLDLAIQFETSHPSFQTVLDVQEALQTRFPGCKVDMAVLNGGIPSP